MTDHPGLSVRAWRFGCAALVALCVLVGGARLTTLPLDSHEIFVAQTVHEMSVRGDWIVPYFNGRPRLNKPPLSYWATGLVAHLAGDLPRVAPWHARLVSLLAGLGLLICTVLTAALVFDRLTALVAGGLVASSAGLFTFMHDARPDMLYAFCTSAMVLGIAWSACRPASRGRALCGGVGLLWLSFALATLTKGPHVPALTLAGAALALRRVHGSWAAAAEILRPGRGFALAVLVGLPWWAWLKLRLAGIDLEATQLGGALLTPALARLGDPYYFYRPLQLILPWLPLAALALIGLSRRIRPPLLGFVGYPLLVVCLGLSFGRQFRFFYLLPLLGLLAIAIAALLVAIARSGSVPRWGWAVVGMLQGGIVLACGAWVMMHAGDAWLGPTVLLAVGTACALLAVRYLNPGPGIARAFAALVVWMSFAWPAAALTGALWNAERYAAVDLARTAASRLAPDTPLVTLDISPTVFVYYCGRQVTELAHPDELATLLARNPRIGLVTRDTRLASLAASFDVDLLGRARRGDGDDVLVRLGRKVP